MKINGVIRTFYKKLSEDELRAELGVMDLEDEALDVEEFVADPILPEDVEDEFLSTMEKIYEGKIKYDDLSEEMKPNRYLIEALVLSGNADFSRLPADMQRDEYLLESFAQAGIITPEDLPEGYEMSEKVQVAFGLKELVDEECDEIEPEYYGYDESDVVIGG